ncbi:MAG: CoA transferase, partial [Methylobacteriaceae bacterium]|nr:CoA transferase [Methylobacteriaceae bacterium]
LANSAAEAGVTPGVRSAVVMDGAPAANALPAPPLGAHQEEVLRDPNWGAGS